MNAKKPRPIDPQLTDDSQELHLGRRRVATGIVDKSFDPGFE